jgi:hypothetical protein
MKSLKRSNKMKEDIEKLMKNALDGYELPFQDGAWESFQKKMNETSSKNSFKWWIFGSAALAVLICSAYFFQENQNLPNELSTNNNQEELTSPENHLKNEPSSNVNSGNIKSNKIELSANNESLNSNDPSFDLLNEDKTFTESSDIIKISAPPINNSSSNSENSSIPETTQNDEDLTDNFPTFNNKCKNESITIHNTFTYELILKTPSGREIGIEPNSKSDIGLKETGVYLLGYLSRKTNGNFKEMSNFNVLGVPTISLTIDENLIYKNGLPTFNMEANSSEENISWIINRTVCNKYGKNVEFNFFNKGNYTIKATAKNELGCETSESKSIQIEEDYNLLAMSAFNPNSADYRNSTFLPYALKERNSDFKMIILDPDNGGVIFETTEASNPWTGIDRRDGKMVAASKSFIWKVTIINPELGEKGEYKGTVVRVP